MGLTPHDVEGVRAMLLMRTAQPGNGDKLGMAIDLLPAAQNESIKAFVGEIDAMGEMMLSRGRVILADLSDEEWADIIGEEPDANAR